MEGRTASSEPGVWHHPRMAAERHAWIPKDTHPNAYWLQISLYREASFERKAAMVAGISRAGRQIARAGIRSRHPDYSEAQVTAALRRLMWGPELARTNIKP